MKNMAIFLIYNLPISITAHVLHKYKTWLYLAIIKSVFSFFPLNMWCRV